MNIFCPRINSGLNPGFPSSLTSLPSSWHWEFPARRMEQALLYSPTLNTSLPEKLLLIHWNPNAVPFSFIHPTHYVTAVRDPVGKKNWFPGPASAQRGCREEREGGAGGFDALSGIQKFIGEMKTGETGDLDRVQITRALLL